MRQLPPILLLAALPAIALAVGGADAPDGDGKAALEKIRTSQPQLYARLKHNLAVLQNLPPERQEALRKLDRDLHDEITSMRQRLERVAERYADWLDRLSPEEKKSVVSAPDRKTRLARIREIKEAQWLKRLPKAQADKVAKAPPAERGELLKKFIQEEIDERTDWQIAQRHWEQYLRAPGTLPLRPEQMPDDTREALEKSLRPLLTRAEEQLLKDAEGKWPRYARVLVDLADSHPVGVLGPIGPTTIKELQLNQFAVQALEKNKKLHDRLKETEGKWPEFGVAVREVSRIPGTFGKGRLLPPLPNKFTPARPQEFPPGVQQFIEKKLVPALDEEEAFQLRKTEGEWPAYPRLLVDLSRKHNLPMPGVSPRFDQWDRYRWRSLTATGRRFD